MAAPIAPGPAIKGVARGNTEMSCFATASAVSSRVVVVPPEGRAKTMSMEFEQSNQAPWAAAQQPMVPHTNCP
jgi:hypothetical protein